MSTGVPCLVCGALHPPPVCEPEMHTRAEDLASAEVGAHLFRRSLTEVLDAWTAGDAVRLARAFDGAKRLLGR